MPVDFHVYLTEIKHNLPSEKLFSFWIGPEVNDQVLELQEKWKFSSAGKQTGLGKTDFCTIQYSKLVTTCLWNHQTFVAYFVNSIHTITITTIMCLICMCHCHRQRRGRWCSCLTCVRKQPHSWSFFVWHMQCAEVIPWTCLRLIGWFFRFSWAKKCGWLVSTTYF